MKAPEDGRCHGAEKDVLPPPSAEGRPTTHTLIPIERSSYETQLPGEPRRLMPSVAEAQDAREFWEWASQEKAVALEPNFETVDNAMPEGQVRPRVSIDIDTTFLNDGLATSSGRRLSQILDEAWRGVRHDRPDLEKVFHEAGRPTVWRG